MDENKRKGFSFLRSYFEAAKELPKEEQADFLMAICSYALDGEEPDIHGVASAMFKLVKPNVDTSIKRQEAGANGGKRSRRNKQEESENVADEVQEESKLKANDKQSVSKIKANNNQNETKSESNANQTLTDIGYRIIGERIIGDRSKDIGEREKNKKEKPPKHKYGEYQNVLLSDEELQKLQAEFPLDWQNRIENVSSYCASHGKTYKDYLATIRNWARRDNKVTPKTIPKNDIQAGLAMALDLIQGSEDG